MTSNPSSSAAATLVLMLLPLLHAFSIPPPAVSLSLARRESTARLHAAPRRFDDNVDGVLYVNDKCINCAACSNFAPTVFSRSPEGGGHHVVHAQPDAEDPVQLDEARAALAACPVAAIRVENSARLNHANKGDRLSPEDEHLANQLAISPRLNGLDLPFPRPLLSRRTVDDAAADANIDTGVHFLGSHNDRSFGATPYLARGRSHTGELVGVMVDTPKFTPASVRAVQSLLTDEDGTSSSESASAAGAAPDYLFLTHVDDTADHLKWRERFAPTLKRIFHEGDLGRYNWLNDKTLEDVEVLLRGMTSVDGDGEDGGDGDGRFGFQAWNLDGEEVELRFEAGESWPSGIEGDFVILHTPGHSPGSISLLYRSPAIASAAGGERMGVLFTGDTFAWTTRNGGHMSGFPRYGNNLRQQAEILENMVAISRCYDVVAPGHGHLRNYLGMDGNARGERKKADLKDAVEELRRYSY